MKRSNKPLTAIDLFCGAGGLTLGLKRAGFRVLLGVEIDPEVAKTYKANHLTTKCLIKDIREMTGAEISELVGLERIDLVAGCPPCQGFSRLTCKYHRKDPRDDLVLEMARIVEETKPNMVMMENVPGLTKRGKRMLSEFKARLTSIGYLISEDILQMADYGVPQRRTRFVLLAGKGFRIPLPEKTHCQGCHKESGLRPWLTLGDSIKNLQKPIKLSEAKKKGGPKKFHWHVVRDLKQISLQRMSILKEGDSRYSLPRKLRPKCHKHSNKGFANVYGRLSWNQVAPTVTRGCTIPAMGRFGHPEQLRTLSVREAALLQTFPNDYEFDTEYMNAACKMIGNALPCIFAIKVANVCINAFDSNYVETEVE